MTTPPYQTRDSDPVALDGPTRAGPTAAAEFRPLDLKALKEFGTLKESATNRWRVRQR